MEKNEIVESYTLHDGSLEAKVVILKMPSRHIKTYAINIPKIERGTTSALDDIKTELLKKITISSQEALNLQMAETLKERLLALCRQMIIAAIPHISPEEADHLSRRTMQEMLGLGDIEFLLKDNQIEEICLNGANMPVWAYHRKYGWLPTTIIISSENQIWNYSSAIARGVGRQINIQSPLLDAYLSSGDRVNATLAPISYFGNTITIRKFARKPWTITDFIKLNTISSEVAAIIWLAVQYELNIIIAGGTGVGKTSFLNVLSSFIPQNQRVVSIEQTREITLPTYLQWVPTIVREPTNEGRGEVGMLDLMVNSLRMRPDRIIVGEIRRAEEAEVLFEGMHTGHSVYATMHAETVSETVRRLVNPPLNIPPVMMESLHLIISLYRDRKSNIRRVYEVGELIPIERGGVKENIIYRWKPHNDKMMPAETSVRLFEAIKVYTNMGNSEIKTDLDEKVEVLEWLVKNNIDTVDSVGEIISAYYDDPTKLLKRVREK